MAGIRADTLAEEPDGSRTGSFPTDGQMSSAHRLATSKCAGIKVMFGVIFDQIVAYANSSAINPEALSNKRW